MSISADISRIDIALHGVSADLARAAADGLDAEIRRRLGALRLGHQLLSTTASVDVAELAIAPVVLQSDPDAASLRGLLAEHIAQALYTELSCAGEEGI